MNFLIIDDNLPFRDGLSLALKDKGHTVDTASLPLDVLIRLDRVPDVVILDYHLPGSDGQHLLEELRRHKGWKDIPVIIATSDPKVISLPDIGPSKVLIKPITTDDVLKIVDELKVSK